jgi:hypothetical protein
MVILNAHFDGKTIVLDEPFNLPLRSGTRLKIRVETVDEKTAPPAHAQSFRPLNIRIEPGLSHEIALDPDFNIEES